MTKRWRILVVDDEHVMRESMASWLRQDGYEVDTAASGREALDRARERDYAICFLDLKMPPGIDGIETMMEMRKLRPEAAFIVITAYATVDTAITAIKEGAQDYIVKPCSLEEISLLVQRILKVKKLQRENLILRKKLQRRYEFQDIISKSPRMHEIFELIRKVGPLRSTVLVTGESGTGKEMVARALHNCGGSGGRPFVAVSCSALAETLLESELFGHERGAFTGAVSRKRGKLEMASGGTLFLDEIGDISSKLQMDLLRVLEEKRFFRVGGTEEVALDARVIAATKVDLQEAVRTGRFRDDLFYRLNVVGIRVPPLRERREDIPLLVGHFVERLSMELGREIPDVTQGAVGLLVDREWPGNVRELENSLERAIVTCTGRILAEESFAFLAREGGGAASWQPPSNVTLEELERQVVEATLRRTGGNVKAAAEILGIDRSTLYDKIHRYGIPRGREAAPEPDPVPRS
ncbi:MAG TPA: sigma-54 dependent transcriptional regulator [Candidatus Saccharimonadales bacterium]|nr:sigma-54 dependent transcriptional regulator [Candidatus Saccharimonadales bacterium]